MRPSISFLIDESLPPDAADAVRELGYDVLYVRDSYLRGAPDSLLWEVAGRERRILVTRDLDFPLLTRPTPLGLVVLRVPSWYRRAQIGDVIREFLRDTAPNQIVGHVLVVRPTGLPRYRSLESI